ncbi:MAG: hypothetical protein V2I36_02500 [Desulfopila sp.]|jgi:hypothetical protein|nr:hypothetical protein [Desulfopila sp.]
MAEKQSINTNTTDRLGKIGNRPFWVFAFSIILRAIHQVGAAVFLASYLLDTLPAPPSLYVFVALGTGVPLYWAEWMRHREIYREFSGISIFAKLVLLGLAYHGFFPAAATVLAAFLLASIASHAPKQYRHRLLF